MKFLYLMRHARAESDDLVLADLDRKLTPTGAADAQAMGIFLKDKIHRPDIFLTSTAARASQTAQIVSEQIDFPLKQIKEEITLYLAPASMILSIIKKLPDTINSCFLVGHNPGIENLFIRMGGTNLSKFPTAAVAAFSCDKNSWKMFGTGSQQVLFYQTPKTIRHNRKD